MKAEGKDQQEEEAEEEQQQKQEEALREAGGTVRGNTSARH